MAFIFLLSSSLSLLCSDSEREISGREEIVILFLDLLPLVATCLASWPLFLSPCLVLSSPSPSPPLPCRRRRLPLSFQYIVVYLRLLWFVNAGFLFAEAGFAVAALLLFLVYHSQVPKPPARTPNAPLPLSPYHFGSRINHLLLLFVRTQQPAAIRSELLSRTEKNQHRAAALARLMIHPQQDEGSSSSVTSSPLQNFSNMPLHPSPAAGATPPWMLRELRSDERGLCLIHLLLNCAAAAAAGRLDAANAALEHIAALASPDGDAMQRVAAAFAEALARRALRAWPGLCRALLLPRASPTPAEVAVARRHFLDLCPFLRLAGAAANQAVLEAMESEKIVHVIDLGGADATHWLELLHLLAARPEGPPHFRLTAVHEHKDLLTQTAMALTKEAERLDVPFQFNPVVTRLDALDVESLRVKTGEALAITSSLQLHRLLATDDDSASAATAGDKERRRSSPDSSGLLSPSTSRADAFLGALWGLSPKIMVLTEQEASHNTPGLTERFVEALNYYAALFDCLEVGAARGSVERARVERWLLGEEIKNIVACDGGERRERHERHERWAARMEGAGFGRVPLSYYSLLQARRAAQGLGCDGFKVREEKGVFFLCWQDRALFSVSAWRGRRFD